MPNETVVQYILTVDTDKAENSLEAMSKEGNEVKRTLDSIGKSSTKTSKDLGGFTKKSKNATQGARNLRRAGRDLDGALQDISQGVSLINPALGSMFQTLSRGASISEGFGRILAGAVNPYIKIVGAITLVAGAALYLYNYRSEKAAALTKEMTDKISGANKVFEEQDKVIKSTNEKLAKYVEQISNATMDLALLTGSMSLYEVAQKKATKRAEEFGKGLSKDRKTLMDSLVKEVFAAQKLVDVAEKKRKLFVDDLSNAELRGISENKTYIALTKNVNLAKQKREELRKSFRTARDETKEVGNQVKEFEKLLLKIEKVKEVKRKGAEAEKSADAAKSKRDKEDAEAEKKQDARAKERERQFLIQNEAVNKLKAINVQLTEKNLTKEELIKKKYKEQVAEIRKLGFMTGEIELARHAELEATKAMNKELDELLTKEEKRVILLKEQLVEAQALFDTIALSIGALSSPESMISNMGGIVSGIGGTMGMAGLQAAGPAIGAAGSVLTATAGIGAMVQQVIDESIAANQAAIESGVDWNEIPVILDEESGRKVVYDNMLESFDIFFKNLERGLEILPEIIVRVLPEFVASLTKVLADPKLIKLLVFDIPLAILRTIPSIIMTVINEIGYAFANVVETLSNIVEILRSILSGDFFRQDRDMGQENRQKTLERWFPGSTDTGGLEAANESSGGAIGRWFKEHYDFASLYESTIGSAQGGMRFTGPGRQGLAMLHQNEFVVPASGQRPQSVDRQMSSMGGGGVNITINSAVVEQNAIDALVRKIEERFNSSYGLASSNLFGGR